MTNRSQATLFANQDKESSDPLIVYCTSCGDRAFKVNEQTVIAAGILSLKCLECKEITSVSVSPDGYLAAMPGGPYENLPKKKRQRKGQGEPV